MYLDALPFVAPGNIHHQTLLTPSFIRNPLRPIQCSLADIRFNFGLASSLLDSSPNTRRSGPSRSHSFFHAHFTFLRTLPPLFLALFFSYYTSPTTWVPGQRQCVVEPHPRISCSAHYHSGTTHWPHKRTFNSCDRFRRAPHLLRQGQCNRHGLSNTATDLEYALSRDIFFSLLLVYHIDTAGC